MRPIDGDALSEKALPKNPDAEFRCVPLKDILDAPTIEIEQWWIPCSEISGEGFPKEDGYYIITEQNYGFYLDAEYKQTVVHMSYYYNGDFIDRFYVKNTSNVVAWMPMLKPYKGE